jgi:putative transcriptional regulator
MGFGKKLKELRKAKRMTQDALAAASNIPVGTIRDYEQGRRDPLLPTAQKLAGALGVSMDELAAPITAAKPPRRKAQ